MKTAFPGRFMTLMRCDGLVQPRSATVGTDSYPKIVWKRFPISL